MAYPTHIVVRKNKTTGRHVCSAANQLPLSQYEHVASMGHWYGSQMGYQPYRQALIDGHALADKLNAEA